MYNYASRDLACSRKLTSFMVVKSFTFTICTIVSLALMHVHTNWHKLTSFMVVKSFTFTISTIMSLELMHVHAN
jgi:hypothetical protein